jgi:hypothetical protein
MKLYHRDIAACVECTSKPPPLSRLKLGTIQPFSGIGHIALKTGVIDDVSPRLFAQDCSIDCCSKFRAIWKNPKEYDQDSVGWTWSCGCETRGRLRIPPRKKSMYSRGDR